MWRVSAPCPVTGPSQVEQLMEQGTRSRTTAATHMNANSSRSHMLIILQLKQHNVLLVAHQAESSPLLGPADPLCPPRPPLR
ncbi:unnamed protein product [Gadus morhua 'NCC']